VSKVRGENSLFLSMPVRKENQCEAEDQAGDEGGKPLQQRVEEREFLSGRCGILLQGTAVVVVAQLNSSKENSGLTC
jgi:hypothetical protein